MKNTTSKPQPIKQVKEKQMKNNTPAAKERPSRTKYAESIMKIPGGKLDYMSFCDYPDGRAFGALDRLVFIVESSPFGTDAWPLAFANQSDADLFLDELEDEDFSAWVRLTDNMARMLSRILGEGPWGTIENPVATLADAARILREVKEDYFDKGRRFGD